MTTDSNKQYDVEAEWKRLDADQKHWLIDTHHNTQSETFDQIIIDIDDDWYTSYQVKRLLAKCEEWLVNEAATPASKTVKRANKKAPVVGKTERRKPGGVLTKPTKPTVTDSTTVDDSGGGLQIGKTYKIVNTPNRAEVGQVVRIVERGKAGSYKTVVVSDATYARRGNSKIGQDKHIPSSYVKREWLVLHTSHKCPGYSTWDNSTETLYKLSCRYSQEVETENPDEACPNCMEYTKEALAEKSKFDKRKNVESDLESAVARAKNKTLVARKTKVVAPVVSGKVARPLAGRRRVQRGGE